MFKKTLLAAAIATSASFVANASTVTPAAAPTIGVEYAAAVKVVDADTVTIELGRDYAPGDIVTLTVTGATLVKTTGTPAAAVTPTVTGTGNAATNVEFLQYKDNTVRVLITGEIDTTTGTHEIVIAGLKLDISGAKDEAKVSLSAAGRVDTVDGPIDVDASAAATYITFEQQLVTAATTKFDATVDVNAARLKFADAGTTDTLVLTNTQAALTTGVTTTGATYTVYGDFSFLDENGDGDLADAKDGSITSSVGTVAVAEDMMSAVITSAAALPVGTSTVGITVNSGGSVIIPDQSFMAKASVAYTNPADTAKTLNAATLAKSDAGSWVLNGAKVNVPVMFFGSQYSQSVTVSNTSTQAGSVDLVIYNGTDTTTVEGVATAAGRGVTDISAAVRNAVAAAGLTGVVSFDVIVNAPDESVQVVALYYVRAEGDRLRTK